MSAFPNKNQAIILSNALYFQCLACGMYIASNLRLKVMSPYILNKINSILKESPLYKTLSGEEKKAVLSRLAHRYPLLDNGSGEEMVGYESSWTDITHKH